MKNKELFLALLSRGYFPKELPPAFQSTDLGNNALQILNNWNTTWRRNTYTHGNLQDFALQQQAGESPQAYSQRIQRHRQYFLDRYSASQFCNYSLPKGKLSRRSLAIPQPCSYMLLAEAISKVWNEIQAVYTLSASSQSQALFSEKGKRSVETKSSSVSDFTNVLLEAALDKRIELRVDIAKFYPSIYSHALPWAFLGKEQAKHYFRMDKNVFHAHIQNGDTEAALYDAAQKLDMKLRACQERQSIGLPIGPDSSHILAELIASRIDALLLEQCQAIDFRLCRYYDDYHIYCNSKSDADAILKCLQRILGDFQLKIQESKVSVREAPLAFEDESVQDLALFEFQGREDYALKRYMSRLWGLLAKEPSKSSWLARYALRRFEYQSQKVSKKYWPLFEDMLLKTALVEASVLDIVCKLFLMYKSFLNAASIEKLERIVQSLLREHLPLQHHHELLWTLWLVKSLDIPLAAELAQAVLDRGDSLSRLLLLDIYKEGSCIQGELDLRELQENYHPQNLEEEQWLLYYEAISQGLLDLPCSELEAHPFFSLLLRADVHFYRGNLQFTVPQKQEEEPNLGYNNQGEAEQNKPEGIELKKPEKKPERKEPLNLPISGFSY